MIVRHFSKLLAQSASQELTMHFKRNRLEQILQYRYLGKWFGTSDEFTCDYTHDHSSREPGTKVAGVNMHSTHVNTRFETTSAAPNQECRRLPFSRWVVQGRSEYAVPLAYILLQKILSFGAYRSTRTGIGLSNTHCHSLTGSCVYQSQNRLSCSIITSSFSLWFSSFCFRGGFHPSTHVAIAKFQRNRYSPRHISGDR